MNNDFLDLLRAFRDAQVRFLVVGAHAMAVHGTPRATGDLDVWVEASTANAERVWQALLSFGTPLHALGVELGDFATEGGVVQIGVPPRRIDLLTSIDGVYFAPAWERRVVTDVSGCPVAFLSYEDLLCNKRTAARPKDLQDVAMLEQAHRHR